MGQSAGKWQNLHRRSHLVVLAADWAPCSGRDQKSGGCAAPVDISDGGLYRAGQSSTWREETHAEPGGCKSFPATTRCRQAAAHVDGHGRSGTADRPEQRRHAPDGAKCDPAARVFGAAGPGARRRELFRQLLSESLLAGRCRRRHGLDLSIFATRALAAWAQIESSLAPDNTVLLFTLGILALAALLFGLAPLRVALAAGPALALKTSSATSIRTPANPAQARLSSPFKWRCA